MPAPRPGRKLQDIHKCMLFSFGPEVFIEARLSLVSASRYRKIEQSDRPWLEHMHAIPAGPLVVLLGLRWLQKDDPKHAAEIAEMVQQYHQGGIGPMKRPLLQSTLTASAPGDPDRAVTIQVLVIDPTSESDDQVVASPFEDFPELREAGWIAHNVADLLAYVRIIG